ncbi:hypothetical protein BT63DRAFT_458430 [Microthyrium microscopicum]|uniref:Zn(2)-C6 fungal-type domain-containing protein n=1 Tax=Microthyrium microscopicum TaxID=703497 RepID=A0A6A6U539_9PEZI|nr:hypothetical protein BT63DRAFT_458430 [Microthyrium microscopicum]
MAAQPTSVKPAIVPAKSMDAKQQSKMHRRSRSGCFTCRLRRKKCDEGKPGCKACHKLAICCEYKRPMWWGNADQRRQQKELIKNQIKNMKIQEKQAAAHQMHLPTNTPPLYHSPSEGMCRTRGASTDSTFSDDMEFNGIQTSDMFAPQIMAPMQPGVAPFGYQPFNESLKIETEWLVNNVASRKDSTISTTYFEALPPSEDRPYMDNWVQNSTFEHHQELLDDSLDFSVFDFGTTTLPSQSVTPKMKAAPMVKVEQRDEYLLFHFRTAVAPLAFPMLKITDPKVHEQVLIAPLDTNQAYFHAALSYAAVHLKATTGYNASLEEDLARHVTESIRVITTWLTSNDPTKFSQVAETSLAMIYLRGLVGSSDQDMCELPWDAHWKAAKDAMLRLGDEEKNMTVAGWVDILGATMTGSKPAYADLYRHNIMNGTELGFSGSFGCDDNLLYLISEIACLANFKKESIVDDVTVCFHIKSLGDHISNNQLQSKLVPNSALTASGALDGAQLSANLSHVYRIAARIYLCSLLPDFEATQTSIQGLVDSLVEALQYVPPGEDGFDRALVWPLLQAGAVSLPNSLFRTVFQQRVAKLGASGEMGAFGRMQMLLNETWKVNDERASRGERSVHWRDVMSQNGWDFLLI